MNGSIANNIGRAVDAVHLSNGDFYERPYNETWLLECDEIRGDGGYKDVYFIVRWRNGNEETGRWNVSQIAGWSYIMQSR